MYVPNIVQFEMENYKLFILDERSEKVTAAFSTAKKTFRGHRGWGIFPSRGKLFDSVSVIRAKNPNFMVCSLEERNTKTRLEPQV